MQEPPGLITREELQLATRNHGLPLEALRYPLTPTGLHYLLTHYDIPAVDPEGWALQIEGLVRRPLSLRLRDLLARPQATEAVTLECAGNGRTFLDPRPVSQPWVVEAVGTAEWTGTPLRDVLEEAGLREGAVEVLFTGLDRGVEDGVEQEFARSLPVTEALREDVLLVHAMNGRPLLPQHGYPLRLVVPGWYGMAHVKWLRSVTALAEPFGGYQQAHAYRMRQSPEEPGEPLARIRPRSLMVPPGVPEFLSRVRHVRPGRCTLEGRAWSGFGPIVRVDVSTDGGRSWEEASMDEAPGRFAWRGWRVEWDAPRGRFELWSRATDVAGNTQPIEPQWNVGGYANNAVQRIPVMVADGAG